MTHNHDIPLRKIVLLEELEASVKLIQLGFGELQNLSSKNNFYFLPFQLLSQGFERFLKSYICLGYFEKTGKFPEFKLIKELGHDLEKLTAYALENYFNEKNIPLLKEDKHFLFNDADLKELLFILSEFGKMARYHNFDIITGNGKPSIDPKERWQAFESKIINANSKTKEKLLDWELNEELWGEISRYIIIIFERYIGALSRQFTMGDLGALAKQYSGNVFEFISTWSSKLGIKDYRLITTRYKQLPKKIHKRNFFDWYRRRYNPNYKSKKIERSKYEGEWPFYAEEVIIECREKNWCIVTINGCDYGLNGSAQTRYKLENPNSAGMAIVGASIGDFISMALELGKE